MEIEKIQDENQLIYKIGGRLDTRTAPDFEDMFDEDFEKGVKNVVFDFKKVEYMSSAGLRAMLHAQKMMKNVEGNLKIINVIPEVFEVFDMTGFTELLSINKEDE